MFLGDEIVEESWKSKRRKVKSSLESETYKKFMAHRAAVHIDDYDDINSTRSGPVLHNKK